MVTCRMGLKCEPDARFFTEVLDGAALVVHGRHSHERQGSVSDRRRRMIISDRSPGFFVHPSISNAWVWNPASMAFGKACRGIGVAEGKIAVSGGTGVFGLFLKDRFRRVPPLACRQTHAAGGRPVVPQVPAKATRTGATGAWPQCLRQYRCSTAKLL
jgi:hypothetical protein